VAEQNRHLGRGEREMAEKPLEIEVTDDYGILALVDPAAYESFVDNDWTLKQLVSHFKSETNEKHLLVWGTR
jgi:hypothetical protein